MNYLGELGVLKRKKRIDYVFSYNGLVKKLIDRTINRSQLRELCSISSSSIAKLGKNKNITTEALLKIFKALDCDISDIMEIVRE